MNGKYRDVLVSENKLISDVLCRQQALRDAVNNKDWTALMDAAGDVNEMMDAFNELDKEREELALGGLQEDAETYGLLAEIRGKLVKSRIENKALADYISITREFVKGIIDTAVPQSRNRLYSRNGYVVQPQPESVVVNTLF
ncbi:MAG: hypothetical protein SPF11_06285 [Treponema porcinum]|mgnify:FL=1|uniref:FlgN protein n=2 Tax=Treponema porcinum TaxID=261392 RepID=A0A1T4KBQ4_TREPO|nr:MULTISPECIES: hypothetical protein [Treponema]MCI6322878.1 hypothetical protein [Treponema porcinum]MCI6482680.1 hypothetical protein [Treponema porcinum]MCI6722149.1 hypothetical protein [Treponema porcinum]MCI6815271.1 hypothetical protein [Treponema porcinum]MCI6984253.1 hypothetical protein [Treponema porcinum]